MAEDYDYESFYKEWNDENDFISVHTSGSTGEPKEIKLSKRFMIGSARRTIDFFRLSSGSRLHSCVSPEFIGGKMMAVRAAALNCNFTWEKPANRVLAKMAPKERITLLAVVPSQMLHILENLNIMPVIDTIIVGGGPVNKTLKEKITASGLNVYETYGMTETSSHIALRHISGKEEWFRTLPGIKVNKNEKECLRIVFESGEVFETNDLVEVKDGETFKVIGRIDHVIISGGKKINPAVVEEKISHLIEHRFIITGEADEKWGQKVILKIEGEENKESKGKLWGELKKLLPPYEMPKEIYYIRKLRATKNGKLIRN